MRPISTVLARGSAVLVLVGFLASPALAIPSPDVVINLVASAGQALGLLAALVGGVLVAKRRSLLASGGAQRGSRWPFRIALLLLVGVSGSFLLYHLETLDRRNERLQTNLVRRSRVDGRLAGDVTLKTLSFSDQLKHPLSISTETLGQWIDEGKPLNLIDVREPEEVEMGRIADTWHRRYPDIQRNHDGLAVPDKQTVMICYSGNRSGELADEFTPQGFDVLFVVGGYEKWIAEDRPLVLGPNRAREELREIPSYPNMDVLLDTPDAKELVAKGAIFIDVRYEKDFEEEHIQGAINLPLRKMPSDEMNAAIAALPKQPYIAVCYDKRASFYGLILGLRLHRAGHEYLGRYTVPTEYFVPEGDRQYIAAWNDEHAARSVFQLAGDRMDGWLDALRKRAGSLALAILFAALGLRLLMLPFGLKAERDRIVSARIKEGLQELGVERKRPLVLLAAQKQAGVKPLLNMVGALAQLFLFLFLFGAVSRISATGTEPFLWLPGLDAPDPRYVLPALVTALFTLHVWQITKARRTLRLTVALATGALIGALVVGLRAGANLYLVISVAFLIAQCALVQRFLSGHEDAPSSEQRVIPLASADLVPGAGNKAVRLARMLKAGLPVPAGFVLTESGIGASNGKSNGKSNGHSKGESLHLGDEVSALLDRAWRRLGANRVAVRSSGSNEDGAEQSFAGVFETVLDVERGSLPDAMQRVWSSLRSSRSAAYSNGQPQRGGIIVQRMVPARYAGVLFTEHPKNAGARLVEMVAGLGEEYVSGRATPTSWSFTRATDRPLQTGVPDIDLRPLLELGRKVEALFGRPQDIEWAYARGRFHLLQSRDITASSSRGESERAHVERERLRLLRRIGAAKSDEVVYAQNELSELLPNPSPFSRGFMDRLWQAGGSVERACRLLGVRYDVRANSPSMVESAFGPLYVDKREERRRLGRSLSALASFRLSRLADQLERELRSEFLPRFQREVRAREIVDLSRLNTSELIDLFEDSQRRFVDEVYVRAECANVLADFTFKAARRSLQRCGLDPAVHLVPSEETIVAKAYNALAERRGDGESREFLRQFGHRAPVDFEFSAPRFGEDPALVAALAARVAIRRHVEPPALPAKRLLRLAVDRARRFQVLKEELKHQVLRDVALLRRILLEISGRLELNGGIFFLAPEEVVQLKSQGFKDGVIALIEERRRATTAWKSVHPPAEITAAWLEDLGRDDAPSLRPVPAGELAGVHVAGDGDVVGVARVLRSKSEIDSFVAGEILVARFTDPEWTSLFPMARGIVTEVGGWLSHAAIQARECGIPAIIGVRGALDGIRTGAVLRLKADGRIERFADRRREERRAVSLPVTITAGDGAFAAMLVDLSPNGARLVPTGAQPVRDGTFEVAGAAFPRRRARVVRRGTADVGLRFETAVAIDAAGVRE